MSPAVQVVFPLLFSDVLLPWREGTPGRSWSALETTQGGKATVQAAKWKGCQKCLEVTNLVTLVWASCKVCIQRKQEKRETDFSLGREAARARSGTGNVDVDQGARRPHGQRHSLQDSSFQLRQVLPSHSWPHPSHCPMASLPSLLKSCPY